MKRVATALLLMSSLSMAQTTAPQFRLKPGDEIRVVVLGYSEYISNYIVLSDGTISGIGFGQIKAAGKTCLLYTSPAIEGGGVNLSEVNSEGHVAVH